MENRVFAKVGAFLQKVSFTLLSATIFFCVILSGCASSSVASSSATHVDTITQDTKGIFEGSDVSVGDSYQNTSQTAKGALVGGAAGGIVSLTSRYAFLPGLAIGAVLGAGYGAYIDANTSLTDKLENRGATVIVLGDQVRIVLPSARVFQPATANIKPQAYSTLKLLAKYINGYDKMLVKVSVYTDRCGPSDINLALSQMQADNVAKYMLASGLDARVLYADGYGGTHLVERSGDVWDDNDNYRIEITLRKLYV